MLTVTVTADCRRHQSRDPSQLRGESIVGSDDCGSQRFQAHNASRPIVPCGLSAWSMFNDTYSILIPSETVQKVRTI